MRELRVRLLILLLAVVSLAAPALAQGETNGTNDTSAPDAPTNDTNTTTPDDGAGGNGSDNTTGNGTEEPPVDAGPTTPPDITIVLEGTDVGGYFFIDEQGRKNPTLTVLPGQRVTFQFKSVAGAHNLMLSSGEGTPILPPGRSASFEWTAPESGSVEYWCDPHKSNGMRGTIRVQAASTGGGGAAEEIDGPTVDLGKLDPACAGQVAPAIVTTGVTGGPTLQDYIAKCKQVEGEAGPERAKHVVDYVIPLSWALIALGIVGVVWVHKYYKP